MGKFSRTVWPSKEDKPMDENQIQPEPITPFKTREVVTTEKFHEPHIIDAPPSPVTKEKKQFNNEGLQYALTAAFFVVVGIIGIKGYEFVDSALHPRYEAIAQILDAQGKTEDASLMRSIGKAGGDFAFAFISARSVPSKTASVPAQEGGSTFKSEIHS